jgi:DNA-binding transcriptional LysR family regulator
MRQVLPKAGEQEPALAWRDTLADLEARAMDVAVIPIADAPIRFARHVLYDEDFVISMRAKHPLARRLTLDAYCSAQHLVVSETGDAYGFVDTALSKRRKARHVALTVPNFMFALATIAATDLIAALPRRFVMMHGQRFGVVVRECPIKLPGFAIALVAPKAALADEGFSWLVARIEASASR